MPLTEKGSKILSRFMSEYGKKKGKSVFYASINKGTIKGAEGYAHGGPITKPAVSDTLKKKDYYDTDITKTVVKAHKPKDYYDTDISKTKVKAHLPAKTPGKSHGGMIEGPGSGRSDSISAKVKKGSFIVPSDQALMAQLLRQDMLGEDTETANLNQKGGSNVRLSSGEHMFSPMEAKTIHKKLKKFTPAGINSLAPNANKKYSLNKLLNHGRINKKK